MEKNAAIFSSELIKPVEWLSEDWQNGFTSTEITEDSFMAFFVKQVRGGRDT